MGIIDFFRRIFIKEKQKNNVVYETLSNIHGRHRRSAVNYRGIATQAYKKNFITFRCLEEIIKGSCQINFKVFKKGNEKDREVKNHEAVQILNNPNDLYGKSELLLRVILFYYLGGEAPFQLMRNTFRSKLFVYRPDRITKDCTGDPFLPYRNIIYESAGFIHIPEEEFFLMKRFDPLDILDGLGTGMSLLEPVLKVIDQSNTIKDWNISLLENGGSFSGIVSIADDLGEAEYERTKAMLKTRHQGAANVGKFLLLEGGASFHQTSINPKDSDWVLGEKSTIQQVCSGLGVDPIHVGFNEFSSYNNKLEASKSLYRDTIIPLMTTFIGSINTHFQKVQILKENEYIVLDYSHIPVLQQDLKELSDRLEKMDFLTINQKRRIAGEEEIPGGDVIVGQGFVIKDGNLYIPLNLVQIDTAADTAKPPPETPVTNSKSFY